MTIKSGFTPLGLAMKLGARAFLESASFEGGKARYSFLLVREAFRVWQEGDAYFIRLNTTVGFYSGAKEGQPHDLVLAVRSSFPFPRRRR